jgi:hypothetical protein
LQQSSSPDKKFEAVAYRIECPSAPNLPPIVVVSYVRANGYTPGPRSDWAVFEGSRQVNLSWREGVLNVCATDGTLLYMNQDPSIRVEERCAHHD